MILRNSFGRRGRGVHQPAGRLALALRLAVGAGGESLPLEGPAQSRQPIAPRLEAAPDRDAELRAIETRLNKLRSPFRTAEAFWVEEIIDPRRTRGPLLCEVRAPRRAAWLTPGPFELPDPALGPRKQAIA